MARWKQKGARNFAQKFYKGKAWKSKSKAYRMNHPLCERCLKAGRYTPSILVHHKVHIDESNFRDPSILYDENNLEALCYDCHAKEHSEAPISEYDFAEDGSIVFEEGENNESV